MTKAWWIKFKQSANIFLLPAIFLLHPVTVAKPVIHPCIPPSYCPFTSPCYDRKISCTSIPSAYHPFTSPCYGHKTSCTSFHPSFLPSIYFTLLCSLNQLDIRLFFLPSYYTLLLSQNQLSIHSSFLLSFYFTLL